MPQSLRLHALTSPDRIWGLFRSRAMCTAMNILGSVLSKLWLLGLPMNHADLPKLMEITFEAILPGRQQHD